MNTVGVPWKLDLKFKASVSANGGSPVVILRTFYWEVVQSIMDWKNETHWAWCDTLTSLYHRLLRIFGSPSSSTSPNASSATLNLNSTHAPTLYHHPRPPAPQPWYKPRFYQSLRQRFPPKSLRHCHDAYCTVAVASACAAQSLSPWRNVIEKKVTL